jgi:BirA family biotin operon repressor/biotin-[acetyl-CoA-carboxylase] ligase
MYTIEWIKESIKTLPLTTDVVYYPTIGSTNTEGIKLLKSSPPHANMLLLAQEQTAGRGRFQRQWISDPDDSLTFSLVLTELHHLPVDQLGLLPLLGAFSVVQALLELEHPGAAAIKIKWPNDLLLNGRKASGILSEACWEDNQLRGVVLGIGINVGEGAIPPAGALRYPATSIASVFGTKPAREPLLLNILTHFFSWLPRLQSGDFHTQYQNHLAFIGESVNIFNEAGQQSMTGVVQGISSQGDLVLLQNDNNTILCSAGEITVRPTA